MNTSIKYNRTVKIKIKQRKSDNSPYPCSNNQSERKLQKSNCETILIVSQVNKKLKINVMKCSKLKCTIRCVNNENVSNQLKEAQKN